MLIKFNTGPKLSENQLDEAEEQVGDQGKGSAVPGGELKPWCKSIPIGARFQVLPPQLKK